MAGIIRRPGNREQGRDGMRCWKKAGGTVKDGRIISKKRYYKGTKAKTQRRAALGQEMCPGVKVGSGAKHCMTEKVPWIVLRFRTFRLSLWTREKQRTEKYGLRCHHGWMERWRDQLVRPWQIGRCWEMRKAKEHWERKMLQSKHVIPTPRDGLFF